MPPVNVEVEFELPCTLRYPWKVEVPVVLPWMVVVAVVPTYILLRALSWVVEAPALNCSSAVYVLAVYVFGMVDEALM